VERGELECVLIGFGPRVAEEEAVVGIARYASQLLGQTGLERVFHRIGVEAQTRDLLRDGPHVVRVGMADRDHGVSAVEVEVLRAGRIIDETAPAAYRFDGVEGIYVEKFHVFPFVFRRRGGLGFRMRRL